MFLVCTLLYYESDPPFLVNSSILLLGLCISIYLLVAY